VKPQAPITTATSRMKSLGECEYISISAIWVGGGQTTYGRAHLEPLRCAGKHGSVRRWRSLGMRCDAMRCDAMRCDAMRCDAMRCDAMRCDAMRCDAMRCDAMEVQQPRSNEAKNDHASMIDRVLRPPEENIRSRLLYSSSLVALSGACEGTFDPHCSSIARAARLSCTAAALSRVLKY